MILIIFKVRNGLLLVPDKTLFKWLYYLSIERGFIPIADDGKLLGAVTDRDLVTRVIAKGKDPKNTTAKEIMTPQLYHVSEDQDVQEVRMKCVCTF